MELVACDDQTRTKNATPRTEIKKYFLRLRQTEKSQPDATLLCYAFQKLGPAKSSNFGENKRIENGTTLQL